MSTYRGRLIFPLLAEIYRLDTLAIGGNGNFDTIYREPKKTSSTDRLGASSREEEGSLLIPAQFEPESFGRLHMLATGDASTAQIDVIFHFTDLEAMGLIESTTGSAVIRKGARLASIRRLDETLEQAVPNPPGMFATHSMPIYGIANRRNLLKVTFASRDPGK